MNNKILQVLPGLIFAVIIGVASYYLSKFHVLLDPLMIGILFGIITRLFIGNRQLLSFGLEFSPRILIPLGVVLYGVNLEFQKLSNVMPMAWLQMLVMIVVIFWLADFFGRWLKINGKISVLIAVGTAICGASAIMMAAPTVKAEKEDTGKALLIVVFFGVIGAFLYPSIQKFLAMPIDIYALFAATTLHTTGAVKTAVLFLGKNTGILALSIKLARTALIVPIIIALVFIFQKEQNSSEVKSRSTLIIYLSLAGFIFVGLLFSFVPGLTAHMKILKSYSAILWTLAMASIGLTIDIRNLLKDFARPLLLGLLVWLGAIAIFMLGYWLIII